MADSNGTPLDEIQWRDPEAAKFYGGINADDIHLYFLGSPFCDNQSNNKNLEVQARYNPDMFTTLSNRQLFQEKIRESMGVSYLIQDGPITNSPDMNPVWLIRRQNKSRDVSGDDVVDIEGSFYAIGENIYQAPSIKDILTCRLVCK
jgi:mediator of RNA polymerase II transcription subunit 6